MTALQPPPPFPTHSVNPDHSAFGTTTLYAENRTTVLPTGDVQTGATAFFLVPAGKSYFVAGDPNHVASAATATREYAAATAAINTPCRPSRVVPLVLDHFLYVCTHKPPRLPQPRQRGLPLLPQWFRRSLTRPHRFTSCAHPPLSFP